MVPSVAVWKTLRGGKQPIESFLLAAIVRMPRSCADGLAHHNLILRSSWFSEGSSEAFVSALETSPNRGVFGDTSRKLRDKERGAGHEACVRGREEGLKGWVGSCSQKYRGIQLSGRGYSDRLIQLSVAPYQPFQPARSLSIMPPSRLSSRPSRSCCEFGSPSPWSPSRFGRHRLQTGTCELKCPSSNVPKTCFTRSSKTCTTLHLAWQPLLWGID